MRSFGKRCIGRVSDIAPRMAAVLIGMLAALSATPAVSEVPIQSRPLALGNDVPNNLVLVPSVEYPTVNAKANFTMVGDADVYNASITYVGYFDSAKCYKYNFATNEKDRFFEPVGVTANHQCSGALKQWSGNFLNWAVTQTIDPFRKALTGGYRVRDTTTQVWLEKARHDNNEYGKEFFPDVGIPASEIQSVFPASAQWPLRMKVRNLGNKMRFTRDGSGNVDGTNAVSYNPATHTLSGRAGSANDTTIYEVSVRVAVCVNSGAVKPEANCKQYGNTWKPEGLIQKYNDKLRFSIFGYLNDSSPDRDGGVLRARQKYVGPYSYDPVAGPKDNPNKEWDPVTGIQLGTYNNPDPVDATATNTRNSTNVVVNSGVINYLNKFAQTTTNDAKGADNVSELYYAAVRYFRGQDNVPEYTTIPAGQAAKQTDLFPVITDWVNPVQYQCQRNVAVGIGDTYTHLDRNLPGSTKKDSAPAMPPKVAADTMVNVETALGNLFRLEGIDKSLADKFNPGGNVNSGFIAGLAYYSHTKDMQPNMPGMQTLSTYWVDVLPFKVVVRREDNQYYLATKYGGFDVPAGFDPDTRVDPLPDALWTDGDKVGLANQVNEKRPRNFYVAYQAEQMVSGLTRAFESAGADRRGAAAGLGTNGATLEQGATIYSPTYFNDWHGDLTSYRIDPVTKANIPVWTAGAVVPAPAARKIFANSDGYREFRYDLLSAADKTNLGSGSFSGATAADVVDYLRGVRTKEVSNGGPLRNRGGVLGDFVNSSPVYVGKPSPNQYSYATFTGGGKAYNDFAAAKATRTPLVYVGGNDGMLHAFNAATGVEAYAFVPAAALNIPGGLTGYATPGYPHRYFVDGELTVADVYLDGAWKTVLVGTMGRGGKGVFALDITDPGDIKFLWEKYGTQVPSLGNNLGKPVIAQTANGVWRVLLGNGPNSADGKAQLVTLDVGTGAVNAIDTGVGSDNGLSGVRTWDSNADGFIDSAYAGDFKGNLWKFSNIGTGTASATVLFRATDSGGNAQAITATPLVGRKPDSLETWVFFGTGRFLGGTDLSDKSVQTWYGIRDAGTLVTAANLATRTIEYEGPLKDKDGKDVEVRVISASKEGDMTGKLGWKLDLVTPAGTAMGERMVVPNLFDGNRLLGISRIPNNSDPCNVGGNGWLMEIDPFTGGRIDSGIFDINGDGVIDNKDAVAGTGDNPSRYPSGKRTDGSLNPVVIIPGKNGNLIEGSNQDDKIEGVPTPVTGLGAKRVAWREILRDG